MTADSPEWIEAKALARKAIWADGRGMIGRERNYLEDRVARAILAERSAAKRRIEELEADATADDIEAAARGMYGSKWDSPKDDERPGEKMKDVWRKYAADAIAGFLARRALLRAKEGNDA